MGLPAPIPATHDARSQTLASLLGNPRYSNQLGAAKLVVPAADAVGFALAAFCGTLIQWWYSPLAATVFDLWAGQAGLVTFAFYAALVVSALGRFWLLGHYTRRRPFADETREMLSTLMVLAVIDAALLYLGKQAFSRSWFLSTWALALILVPTARVLSKSILIRLGKWQIPTIVIGTGANAREAAEALHSERLMGMEVVAFGALTFDEAREHEISVCNRIVPVAHLVDPVADITAIGSPNVVVALEQNGLAASQRLVERLHRQFSELSIVPALRGLPLYGMEINHFFRHEALFLRLHNNLGRRGPRLTKRLFDVFASATLLLLLSPLFAYIAAQIKRSGGSVFFGHTRIGRNGQAFKCYKFRSMVPNAQSVLTDLLDKDPAAKAAWQREFKLKDDPRVTPIGAFLRKTSLDELPQLWNVLRGDMSLVGPRPVTRMEISLYGEDAPYYLGIRPGMTGLWQISGRNDVEYKNRVYLDTWYVKNWSLWQDIVILVKTFHVVLRRTGAY